MERLEEIIQMIILLVPFVGLPVFLTVVNIVRLFTKKKLQYCIFDVLTVFFGSFYSVMYMGAFAGDGEYYEPVVLGGVHPEYHTPISGDFSLSFVLFALVGGICLLLLSFMKRRKPPIISALLIGGVYMGNVLGLVFCLQIIKHCFENVNFVLFVFPINFLLMSIRLIRQEVKKQVEYLSHNETQPKNKFIGMIYNLLKKSTNWYWFAFAALIPLLAVLLVILILFGQSADGIIKAFTMTADWTFSTQVPPPPVQYEGHYLCTVAAGGHDKIVKPQRMGVRLGEKIIVNRQLCIANAFEDLIHEKMPKFHKKIRNFYDNHGYPLSRKITTPTRADIVYILMKPLEWVFLIMLYTFDVSPENRIAVQYTGKKC
ncbi:MAG: DUF6688 family protein [Hominimerdicola sp.]